ncbi:fumarylacetoacetate hydrolase family protein [Paenibacillus alkaliterrae]|uniref:fumarylacetoacetate hydrolase family protein n=1 Tax=Paenibacillus alkaliterrae TaxID=320909 RepID=UPI001F2A0D05|nr:fumarylacetoacetate hydrolase family protein [Paenibacillus alkaliterrae]MCF2940057.1 fumarylacetoacetate hydrolase family protein [Paenibacillus alkaliterrae]
MKLVTIESNQTMRLGIKVEDRLFDVEKALEVAPQAEIPTDVMQVISSGEAGISALSRYMERVLESHPDHSSFIIPESEVSYGPCVTRPGKIICVGLNYRKHAEETKAPIPQFPILFNKFSNTLTGHNKDIPLPVKVTKEVDYEAELVIVIGKKAKYVKKEKALEHVFGYCAVNDLSARDLQMRTPQWLLGKTCDSFSPLGPYLVTADEVGNPNRLEIKAVVNGEVRQHSNTSDMIFYCDEIVSYISQHMTLMPGDIILTGTPEGVVLGYPKEKRVYLKDGDSVTIEIEKLGKLTNRMIDERSEEMHTLSD